MPSTYTTRNRLEKQAPGENNNNWGLLLNEGAIDMTDEAISGIASYTLSGSKTLSTANGLTDEARCPIQNITGGTGGTITIPNVSKLYLIRNGTSGNVIVTTGSGTTVTIATGMTELIYCIGSNTVLRLLLPVTAGGTGAATASAARTALGLAIGTDVQGYDAQLASLAALSSVANLEALQGLSLVADRLPYANGTGTLTLATLTAAGRALLDDANNTAQVATLGLAKGLSVLCSGAPQGNELIAGHIAPYDYTITTANCSMMAGTAATGSTVFTLKKGATIAGATSIGTATFSAAGTSATISITGSPVSVTAGQFVGLYAPSSADATIADLAGVFK